MEDRSLPPKSKKDTNHRAAGGEPGGAGAGHAECPGLVIADGALSRAGSRAASVHPAPAPARLTPASLLPGAWHASPQSFAH